MSLDKLRLLSQDELIQQIIQYKEELEEMDEFKASSSEIEKLLEADLEAAKREAREKDRRLQLVELEFSRLQDRSAAEKKEATKVEEALRGELQAVKEERDAGRARIRSLEQKNDDFERSDRNIQQEMTDLMAKLNIAIERTSLLENEVAEKQAANEEMYRLREELKERPRQVVEPLRIERNDDTPDEPTPGKERADLMEVDTTFEDVQKPTNNEVAERNNGRGFANSVSKIINDLMAKVDSLESFMTRQRKNCSPRA